MKQQRDLEQALQRMIQTFKQEYIDSPSIDSQPQPSELGIHLVADFHLLANLRANALSRARGAGYSLLSDSHSISKWPLIPDSPSLVQVRQFLPNSTQEHAIVTLNASSLPHWSTTLTLLPLTFVPAAAQSVSTELVLFSPQRSTAFPEANFGIELCNILEATNLGRFHLAPRHFSYLSSTTNSVSPLSYLYQEIKEFEQSRHQRPNDLLPSRTCVVLIWPDAHWAFARCALHLFTKYSVQIVPESQVLLPSKQVLLKLAFGMYSRTGGAAFALPPTSSPIASAAGVVGVKEKIFHVALCWDMTWAAFSWCDPTGKELSVDGLSPFANPKWISLAWKRMGSPDHIVLLNIIHTTNKQQQSVSNALLLPWPCRVTSFEYNSEEGIVVSSTFSEATTSLRKQLDHLAFLSQCGTLPWNREGVLFNIFHRPTGQEKQARMASPPIHAVCAWELFQSLVGLVPPSPLDPSLLVYDLWQVHAIVLQEDGNVPLVRVLTCTGEERVDKLAEWITRLPWHHFESCLNRHVATQEKLCHAVDAMRDVHMGDLDV